MKARLTAFLFDVLAALILKPHIARAYLIAALGSVVIGLLGDSDIKGVRALAILGSGVLLWGFSAIEAVLVVLARAYDLYEIERAGHFAQLFEKPAPDPGRYMVQVEPGRFVARGLDPADLDRLAIGLLQGRPFSERAWAGQIKNFRTWQDLFERRQLVYVKGKQRILNSQGRRAMLQHVYGHAAFDIPSPTEARKVVEYG